MRQMLTWLILSILVMLGCPWLAVNFPGDAAMAVCFILFFAINPLFSAVCGAFAGKNIRQRWFFPVIPAGLFLIGVWIFFEMGEPAFLLYGGCYFLIGIVVMSISALLRRKKQ